MRAGIKLSSLLFLALLAAGCSNDDGPLNSGNNNNNNNTTPKGAVSGVVTDVMGQPLSGVAVTVTPGTAAATTTANGRFLIQDIPVGSYSLRLSREGYQSDSIAVQIAAADTASVDGTLDEIGLLAAYSFAGNAHDVSRNSHNGFVSGARLTTDRFGTADRAYSFDGGAHIEVPHAPQLNFTGGFSIGAWVRLRGSQQNYTGLIAKGPEGTEYPGYMLLIMQGNVVGTATGQPTYIVLNGQSNLNDGNWHYVVLTTNAVTKVVSLYVDGVLERAEAKSNLVLNFTSERPLFIGVERNRINYFRGEIDDIRIFNRALSENEVEKLSRR
jgi:hypothetical protein